MNLLLAAVLLMQDKSAEETFKKIEAMLDSAKTIRFKCSWESISMIAGEGKMTGHANVWMKEGNREAVLQQFMTPEKTVIKRFVSDGTRIASWVGDIRKDKVVLQNQGKRMVAALSRVGHMTSTFVPSLLANTPEQDAAFDREKAVPVTEIKSGPADGKSAVLTYAIVFPDEGQKLNCSVAYDPKTLNLLKRTIELPGSCTITETYEEFVVNADIPDEKFKLPEEKK